MAINRTKQARQMLNNAGAVEQDGVMNYIKNSDSVTVPKEFKARGNAPSTKLAYITADEAKMLKKEKPGTPHKGPKGIPSYDSFDAEGGFTSGAAMSAAETGSSNARDRAEVRAAFGPKGLPPGVTPNEARDLRSSVIAAGAGRRVNPGFFDSRNVISPAELAAARAFAKDRNNRFARAAMRNRDGGLLGLITSGGLLGNLIRGLGQKFGLGKRFNEPTYNMSKFNDLGLMGQVPEDFEDDKKISLSSFIKPEDTIGRVDLNDLEGLSELDFLGRTNLNDYEGILEDEGLTVAPGSIIDEGLLEVPSDFIDQGLLEVPSDFIDQGEIIALANGGRINAMDGGIMDLETGRQMYGLGKLVKKATRAIKKVVKSPLGKAALGLAAFKFGPAFLSGKGLGLGKAKTFSDLAFFGKNANVNLARLIGVPALLAGATTPKEEEEKFNLEEYYKQALIDPNAPLSRRILGTEFAANGGRIGYAEGSKEPVAKKVMPLLDMDGMEKDYRADGGFVPIGRMEKADDVPARLSKNEFVFTADAVRNAGGGDVDKGSEVMYNMMKNLEAGGEISEESQGLEGAREMFQTSQRLGEVI
jgi:hypothetical protein